MTLTLDEPAIEDLPPSCKLVYAALDHDGWHSQAELSEGLMLPKRTVRYALERLEEADVLRTRHDLTDARRREYNVR